MCNCMETGYFEVKIPDQEHYSEEYKDFVFERFNSMTSALEALKKGELR